MTEATKLTHTFSSGITCAIQRVGWPAIHSWVTAWERVNPAPVPPIQVIDDLEVANTLHPEYIAAKAAHDAARTAVMNEHGLYMGLRPDVEPGIINARAAEIRALNEGSPYPQELSPSDLIVFLKHDVLLTQEDFIQAIALIDGRQVSREAIEAAKAAMFPGDVQGAQHLEAPRVAE